MNYQQYEGYRSSKTPDEHTVCGQPAAVTIENQYCN